MCRREAKRVGCGTDGVLGSAGVEEQLGTALRHGSNLQLPRPGPALKVDPGEHGPVGAPVGERRAGDEVEG